jgi:hypothetical protein
VKIRNIFCTYVLLILVLGCAKPPIAEMESAKNAVTMAGNNPDVIKYGGSSLERARIALQQMYAEFDSKRYDAARTHAAEAIKAAEKAVADGKTGAVRAKDEASSLLSALKPEIEDTSRNISSARYNLKNLDYAELDRDLMSVYTQTDQAEGDYAEGRYQDSIDKAMNVRSNLAGINLKVSNAITRSKS